MAHPSPSRPIIVRLRNWVGEILLSWPSLQALADEGYQLELVGKPWAGPLFRGSGFHFHPLANDKVAGLQLYRALHDQLLTHDPGFDSRLNTLLYTHSFSSAWQAWRAGLRSVGVADNGRSLLLARALRVPRTLRVPDAYWQLARPFLTQPSSPVAPKHRPLPLHPEQIQAAERLLAEQQIVGPYIVCCPLTGAGDVKQARQFPQFAALSQALQQFGLPLVTCPAPAEVPAMQQACPSAQLMLGTDLGVHAAILQRAALVVANDTGPGHLAALVGAKLVGVHGPRSLPRWRPLSGEVLHFGDRWPSFDEILTTCGQVLASRR
jgi:heptosyltransferase-2